MTAAAIICAICLLIGVPVIVFTRDIIRRRLRKRRHRRTGTLPFLFIPTTDRSDAPTPAWTGRSAGVPEQRTPIQPEPGIADLPPRPDSPEFADRPPETGDQRPVRELKVAPEPMDRERIQTRRGPAI